MLKLVLGRPETQKLPGRGREHIVKCSNLTPAARPHHVILSPVNDDRVAREQ